MLSTQTNQTMLSTEIVKIINDMREEGAAELRHANFMAKVVKVLGENAALNFQVSYKDSTGRTLKCYALPKRETNLMVMSESYKVQAAVYDRMVDLEQAQQPKLPATYIEALEQLISSEKEKEAALLDVKKLNTIIDNEFGWSSILRAAKHVGINESRFSWKLLKSVTIGLGLTPKKVPSPRFTYQNLYPIKAFEIAYPDYDFDGLKPELIDDKVMLLK